MLSVLLDGLVLLVRRDDWSPGLLLLQVAITDGRQARSTLVLNWTHHPLLNSVGIVAFWWKNVFRLYVLEQGSIASMLPVKLHLLRLLLLELEGRVPVLSEQVTVSLVEIAPPLRHFKQTSGVVGVQRL